MLCRPFLIGDMMNVKHSFEELVGNTPLLAIERFQKARGLMATVYAKLEYLNPAGSVKDRAALQMIKDAEQARLLKAGSVIIEPTSGNTGIGLAAVAIPRGYRVILTMPDTMSIERQKLLSAYGAEVVLTPGKDGMRGAIEKANELARTYQSAFIPSQFDNPSNAKAHYLTTGPEIWQDTDGDFDIFVASVGTGGTLTGTARYLKEQNPNIQVVAVEPAASPLLSKGYAAPHKIQGIGANFVPSLLDTGIYDSVIAVSDEESFAAARALAKTEGILVGISSGAALAAAVRVAQQPENGGKRIVVLLPDTGDRYLSTELFEF